MKVYLVTEGEYSDYRILRIFRDQDDADSYGLGDNVEEWDVDDAPVPVRSWITLTWYPELPDATDRQIAAYDRNPATIGSPKEFNGDERNCSHQWINHSHPSGPALYIEGWDVERVRKVYSEQRAQYIANRDVGVTP